MSGCLFPPGVDEGEPGRWDGEVGEFCAGDDFKVGDGHNVRDFCVGFQYDHLLPMMTLKLLLKEF